MTALGTLQLFMLAALGFLAIAGLAGSLLVAPALRLTDAWSPESRHRALVLVACAPPLLALSAVLATMLPSVLGLLWPGQDHCLVHAGHSHLCFVHASHQPAHFAGWSVVAIAFGWIVVRSSRSARSLLKASRVIDGIARYAYRDAVREAWIVPVESALCLSAGLLNPRLLLSKGLIEATTPAELEIMLAHERAHARRRDSLQRLLAGVASAFMLPSVRERLIAAVELAAERACDEDAVQSDGDRVRVAEAILAHERRMQAVSSLGCAALAAGFGASSVPERVAALLSPRREVGPVGAVSLALGSAVLAVLCAHDFVHHTAESLLAIFSH